MNKKNTDKEVNNPEQMQEPGVSATASTNEEKETNCSEQEQNKSKESEAPEAIDPLLQAQQECLSLKDQLLRTMAEFDNYRKRTMKEKAELIKNGGERVLIDLLPIIDDFELAIKHSETGTEEDPVREGVVLIYNKFIEYLNKQGVKAMDTVGGAFDDNFHEAIALVPAPTPELKDKVIDCTKKGYMLHEKVIRYAQVVVGQ